MSKRIFLAGIFLFSVLLSNSQTTKREINEIIKEWASPTKFPDHVVLSATEDPSTSIAINWRTEADNKVGFVELALAGPGPYFKKNSKKYKAERTVVDSQEAYNDGFKASYFEVKIDQLIPNKIYAYRVGNFHFKSEWHHFKTANNQPIPISFLYVGDAQNYILELWSRVIRNAYKTAPNADFFIHAGDLVDKGHEDIDWNEWFAAGSFIHSEIPAIAVPGNHEYRYLDGSVYSQDEVLSVQWNAQFGFPKNGPRGLEKTCYYIDYPDLKIIALNSNVAIKRQAKWLREVLKSNDKKWIVVTYHHPLFSASTGRDNPEIRSLWQPIFEEYNIDLALQGHDHSYARGAIYEKPVVVKNENHGGNIIGPVYVVSVSGGKMYSVNKSGWDEYGATQAKNGERIQLFQHISINGDRLTYRSFTATGELFDRFELLKENGKNLYID